MKQANAIQPLKKIFSILAGSMLLMGTITGCGNEKPIKKQDNAPVKNMLEIPALFERTGQLSKAAEWPETKMKVAELNEKIKTSPNDIRSRLQVATIYMSEARITGEHPYYYPAILQILEGVLSLDPKNFEALTYKASVLMSQHRFADALQTATTAKEINPDNAYIYGVLVDANVELGNYEEAVKMSDKMQGLKPSLESYSRASYLREIYGDYPGAIEAMIMAVKAGLPGSEPFCWSKKILGDLYEQTGDLKRAEREYLEILALRPSYAFALEGLAKIEIRRKNYDQAMKYLDEAIAIMPEFSFHEAIAQIYGLQGDKQKASEKYAAVLEMLKEDAASGHIVHLDLSKVYMKSEMSDSALVYGLKEYKARPNNIDVNRNLAEIYYNRKDIIKAKEHLGFAMRTGCKNPDLLALADEINSTEKQMMKTPN